MDLTSRNLLETAPASEEEPAVDAGRISDQVRERALDASGPLWPLALNGWMPLDRLPVRHAEAAAVPAPLPGAAP